MRILSKKDLRALVLYSPAHIDRLEKAGLFPKRVHYECVALPLSYCGFLAFLRSTGPRTVSRMSPSSASTAPERHLGLYAAYLPDTA